MRVVLITGVAGFIGFHTAKRYMLDGWRVVGIDDLNDYYDQQLKKDRLRELQTLDAGLGGGHLEWMRWDICDKLNLNGMIRHYRPSLVIHLAAQAGVRYSLVDPKAYVRANCLGHLAALEACIENPSIVERFLYASSSSVYGARDWNLGGFREEYVDLEVESPYAATKLSNEIMSASLARIHPGLTQVGLRFFTVYGPWGRPDMAYYSFAKKLVAGETIELYNGGANLRDFTYVDDIVAGIQAVDRAELDDAHTVMNIGNNSPRTNLALLNALEDSFDLQADVTMTGPMPGDVPVTFANIERIKSITGWEPTTSLEDGLALFAQWFQDYHR